MIEYLIGVALGLVFVYVVLRVINAPKASNGDTYYPKSSSSDITK